MKKNVFTVAICHCSRLGKLNEICAKENKKKRKTKGSNIFEIINANADKISRIRGSHKYACALLNAEITSTSSSF